MKGGNRSCIEILLEEDCAPPDSVCFLRDALLFDIASGTPFGENSMSMRIADANANRRARLKRVALRHLPTDRCRSLGLYKDCLFNGNARLVYSEIQHIGVDVLPALLVSHNVDSIYDCTANVQFTAEIAEYLWHPGFRDIYIWRTTLEYSQWLGYATISVMIHIA
jgi:hypothetical protein